MTDVEFLDFIRACALSNEDIARNFGMSIPSVVAWRTGSNLPHDIMRPRIVRELAMLEHTRLKEQIQAHNAKRGK